jgi:hypothetical protein
MVAAHPAILPAPLFYRKLERAKSDSLKRGLPYDSLIEADSDMKLDIQWWIEQSMHRNSRAIQITHWDVMIETDASKIGWGACCEGTRTGGPWTLQEREHHTGCL